MPRYYDEVRYAKQTAERFEALQVKQEAEALQTTDHEKRGKLRFANWMIGRRIVSFNYFAQCQLEGVHKLATIQDGLNVCTCGLFDETGDHIK